MKSLIGLRGKTSILNSTSISVIFLFYNGLMSFKSTKVTTTVVYRLRPVTFYYGFINGEFGLRFDPSDETLY